MPADIKLIKVSSIQRACVYDGPGLRTTIFLNGCVFRCPWCCNPETTYIEKNFFFNKELCLAEQGIQSQLCIHCEKVGGSKPVSQCPFGAAEKTCSKTTPSDLYNELEKDLYIFDHSGGVTFSGGEPLLQSKALIPLLKKLKSNNVHTAMETTLYVSKDSLCEVLQYINFFYVDIKFQREIQKKKDYWNLLKENLNFIRKYDLQITARIVVVDSLANDVTSIIEKMKWLGIREVEILKVHNLAESKYNKLGISFVPSHCNQVFFDDFAQKLQKAGFSVNKLTI